MGSRNDVMVHDELRQRQAAFINSRLTGMAREYVDEWPPDVILNGGVIDGNVSGPMTFLLHSLAERWGKLGEEERTGAITDLMGFARRPGEDIDNLLARFDVLRSRAMRTGQFAMGFEGLTWLLFAGL